MVKVTDVKVYDLEESIIACRNAMQVKPLENNEENFQKGLERAKKLVYASKESPNVKCHDNFLTGIRVSFNLVYTQYFTKQIQRYHFLDYVSSSSMMHKLTKMNVDESCNKYVSKASVDQLQKDIDEYNMLNEMDAGVFKDYAFEWRDGSVTVATNKGDALYYSFMKCINDCPMGFELFVRVSTNYKQLQTIYWQRKNHKLKEDWGAVCKFIEELPYAKELILGQVE